MKKRLPIEDPIRSRTSFLFRAERRARRISQMELAKKLNMSQGHLSKVDNGLAMPSLVHWTKFLELFDLPSNLLTDDAAYKEHVEDLQERANKVPWSKR